MNNIAFFELMLALGLVGGCGNKKEEKKEEKDCKMKELLLKLVRSDRKQLDGAL